MAVVALVALVLAVEPAAAAIKLVHMQNGRTLKAKSVEREGDWVTAILEEGNTIGFPASSVDFVEDDPLGREDTGAPTNVVTSGREVARRGAFRGNRGAANQQDNRANPLDRSNQAGANRNVRGVVAGANRNVPATGQAARPNTGQPVPGSAVQQPTAGRQLGSPPSQTGRANRFNRLGSKKANGDN